MQDLLQIRGFRLSFKEKGSEKEVIHNIGFEVRKGEIVGLVGESGSGKSVTGLSILNLHNSDQATSSAEQFDFQSNEQSIHLLEQDVEQLQHLRGNKIALIFQEPMSAFNPVIQCGKQVSEVLLTHTDLNRSEAKERVLELFNEVKLPDVARAFDAYPHELSGGQLQRIMIAMAIACNPELIIADEPTTALDVTVQSEITSLLKSLNKSLGTSILFISHDLGVIANLCDRVLVMKDGRIVEQNTVEQLFKNPQHPYTKGLLACRPTLQTQGSRLPELAHYLDEKQSTPQQQVKTTKADNTIVLQASGLSKVYSTSSGWFKQAKLTKAVDQVNITIRRGEVVGLVGESGCGKTTLSNMLLGLMDPTEGNIYFDGADMETFSRKDWKAFRKRVQVIFQNPYSALNPRMPIGKAIEEPMIIHGIGSSKEERREMVNALLSKVGLEPDHYGRYPSQFSGGQRQRIVIARALAAKPECIICDECVSALDVSIQASIINLLLDLRDEYGLSYLFISHDLRVVKFISDRVLVMHQGKIVEEGQSDIIFERPQSKYTKKLLASIPQV